MKHSNTRHLEVGVKRKQALSGPVRSGPEPEPYGNRSVRTKPKTFTFAEFLACQTDVHVEIRSRTFHSSSLLVSLKKTKDLVFITRFKQILQCSKLKDFANVHLNMANFDTRTNVTARVFLPFFLVFCRLQAVFVSAQR